MAIYYHHFPPYDVVKYWCDGSARCEWIVPGTEREWLL